MIFPIKPANPVELRNVTKTYASNGTTTSAVHGGAFKASRGRLILVLGPSGSGKTTLLGLMAGFLAPDEGDVTLFGREISELSETDRQRLRAERLGFVFQSFRLIDALTVWQNVEQVLRFNRVSRRSRERKIRPVLDDLGILHLSDRLPPSLSQGEKQRVAIARAIVHSPSLILADEPTANLESRQGAEVILLLRRQTRRNGGCVIVASHDLRIKDLADEVYWIEDGQARPVHGRPESVRHHGKRSRQRSPNSCRG